MSGWSDLIFSTVDMRWISLTLAAIALAVTTVILARFRVIQTRPIAACVVLSLLAHVLLLLAIYFSSIFETPGFTIGPAINFRLVAGDGPTGELVAPADNPPEIEQESTPDPEVAEETPAEVAEHHPERHVVEMPVRNDALVAPELLPELEMSAVPAQPSEPASLDEAVAEEEKPTSETATDDLAEADPSEWTPLVSTSIASEPSLPTNDLGESDSTKPPDASATRFGHRYSTDRDSLLRMYGGNADTERAVRAALQWLAEHQSPDGRWIASDYGAGTASMIDFQDRRGTGMKADTGVTALALLAMLGAGETPVRGEYQQNLQRGMDYLCRSQVSSGDLAGNADHYARMYCHGMATLALGEVCSIAPQRDWEVALHRALEYSRASQHKATGGWRYLPGDSGDTSQFGWQVMAIVSGQYAGIPVHPTTRFGMEQYLRSVTSGNAGGLAAYRPYMPPTPSMTAESLVCRLLMSPELSPAVDEAVRYILAHPPDEPVLNLYYCYYGSLALHLSNATWDSWNHRMQSAILSKQIPRGEHAGSWGLDTVWGRCGGRVYTTAMATLTLEVYYRYLPLVDRTLARR